jgi:hypothetical protein
MALKLFLAAHPTLSGLPLLAVFTKMSICLPVF